jgi:hypothetical protein
MVHAGPRLFDPSKTGYARPVSSPPPELPADAVLVHIGPHKTGTSAIQSVARASRSVLREHGVDYIGELPAHHRAAKALRRLEGGWARDPKSPPKRAWWTTLVQNVAETPGRALISSEVLAQADAEARAQLVRDLGPERVHIVLAARNPAAMAVSTWQQVLRQGYPVTLDYWLERNFRRTEAVADPEGFWSFADASVLVKRWSEVVSPDRITVIALDEADRRLLPTTFEQLFGLPVGLLAHVRPSNANRGLTAVEAALFLRILQLLDTKLSWDDYSRVVRYGVLMRLVQLRQPGVGEAISLAPEWAIEQAEVEADRIIEALHVSGVNIVGDLESLRTIRTKAADVGDMTQVPIDLAAQAVVGAVSVAAFGNPHLEPPSPEEKDKGARASARAERSPKRTVEAVPTRELAGIVGRRVLAAGRRLIRQQLGRR